MKLLMIKNTKLRTALKKEQLNGVQYVLYFHRGIILSPTALGGENSKQLASVLPNKLSNLRIQPRSMFVLYHIVAKYEYISEILY